MKCPICLNEAGNFKVYIAKCNLPAKNNGDDLVRHRCPKCDVIFGTKEMLEMSIKGISKMYEDHYTPKKVPEREKGNLSTVNLFKYIDIKQGQSCLNWGSGPGSQLAKKARVEFGIDLYNYEPHEATVGDGFGMIYKESDLKTYDFIISRNVIEHFQDPVADLLRMKKFLKPGGKMMHWTKCYGYNHIETKFHTFFFLGKSPFFLGDRIGMPVKRLDEDAYLFG